VTTIVFIAPITIFICDVLGLNPMPMLMAEVLLSNIGGVATLVGDPPNMIIASAGNLNFNYFLAHMFPVVLVVMVISVFMLRLIYRNELKILPSSASSVLGMNEREVIKDRVTLKKSLIVLCAVFGLFLFQEQLGLSPSFIALLGASLILVLVRPDPEEILKEVEWPVLMFFASLFILIGGVEKTGILEIASANITRIAAADLKSAQLLILWLSAVFSSIIGALPFTIVMAPVIQKMGSAGIAATPLWWALAIGAGFGGNGTPIGTAAGVIGLSISERTKSPIGFKNWFLSGTLITLVSMLIASLIILFL